MGVVLRELKGKIDGVAIRVPTPNVSLIDFKFVAKRPTTKDEINRAAVKRAAEQQLKGILGYTEVPNVSHDFNHDPHSSIFHMDQTKVIDGKLVRVRRRHGRGSQCGGALCIDRRRFPGMARGQEAASRRVIEDWLTASEVSSSNRYVLTVVAATGQGLDLTFPLSTGIIEWLRSLRPNCPGKSQPCRYWRSTCFGPGVTRAMRCGPISTRNFGKRLAIRGSCCRARQRCA